jgi:flagellar protein FliL
MSQATATAKAAEAAVEAPVKKRRPLKKILVLLLALVVIGGGAAAGFYAIGGGDHAEDHEEADQPQLVVREGVESSAAEAAMARARAGRPDPRVFKATYIPLEANFTSNLRGGDSFVQIGLGISTYYDERVVANIETHEMALRSAVLMTLSEADPFEITSVRGKEALKLALKNAMNSVLTNKEGFGGIDEVHFTSFVTQ